MPVLPICSICCEHFTPDCNIKTPHCGHIFHRDCILRWLKNTPKCPECRQFGTILYRVYLNFNDAAEDNEANNQNIAITFDTQQQIEDLVKKLSLEEDKNKNLEKRVQELEKKLREHTCAARIKEEELQKSLQFYENMISNVSLEEGKKSRHAVEVAEKSLKKEIMAIKSRQQKPNSSSISIVSQSPNANTVIKLKTSNCACSRNNCGRSNIDASTSISASTSSSMIYPSALRRVVRTDSLALSNKSSSGQKDVTGNISL